MEQIQGEGGSVIGFGRIRKRSVLGCGMSRNGIRSLVIVLVISVLLWVGLAVYIKGVFYG
ncbi:hypothetical protein [Klebsiella quasipneumoniae]|uniref:hypothetical protein n=1 Tax=Klebsiella quasipneumoniae TaxID=1463165 RepID=UPI000B955A93|nr:hypothetical protein [Klebsiella quasipneumoniae]OYM43949.1 hypothetical protein CI754_02365 [Klebsiella quasipneumoniae subsp. similipneumoniae]